MDTIVWFLLTLSLLILASLILLVIVTETYPDSIKLDNCHVVIAGGSSGIGLEIAKFCYQNGSRVTIVARNKKKLETAKTKVEKSLSKGALVQIVSVDISNSAQEV